MSAATEFDIIKDYFTFDLPRSDVKLGVGDDCALVVPPVDKQLAITVDTLVSGVHFPANTSAADIAYKSLAVNLSDLAAMGAKPAWITLALTLPKVDAEWLRAFADSFQQTCRDYDVQLIGGDTTQGPLSITVQATGFITPGKVMRRDTAKAGDQIYVTGALGDAALALRLLPSAETVPREIYTTCMNRLNRPLPRVEFGLAAVDVCSCAIDISDGLLADLGHIVSASRCGAEIRLQNIPLSGDLKAYYASSKPADVIDWKTVLAGGDDYELCLVVSPRHEVALRKIATQLDVALTCIGSITEGDSLMVIDEAGKVCDIGGTGYEHFS